MNNSNTLISIATFREAENIINLINKIRDKYPVTKILIINDFSDDNTKELIRKINDQNLIYLERPKKLGLGTAHKLSIFYAIKYDFKYLLTLDADFFLAASCICFTTLSATEVEDTGGFSCVGCLTRISTGLLTTLCPALS